MTIRLVDADVDGCGTDISVGIEVEGTPSPAELVDMRKAVYAYKIEYEGEWDSDGCFDTAIRFLRDKGYKVDYAEQPVEIVL